MKPEQLEIAQLKREVAKLKAERDILKKAAAYFAKESTTASSMAAARHFPHLEKTKGSIVNRASVSGTGGDWGMSPYNAAKGAVVNLTRALALDMGKKGVRVNSVCPSLTRTGTTEDMMDDKDLLAKFAERIPLGRVCEPEEVAAVIAFLASEDASFMTGANVAVDGDVSPPGPVSHPMIRSALFSVLTHIRTPSSLDVQQIADQRDRHFRRRLFVRMAKGPPLTAQYHVRSIPPGFRVSVRFDSGWGDCGDRTAWGVPAAGKPAILFLPANTARQLVGISVGIGSNRR